MKKLLLIVLLPLLAATCSRDADPKPIAGDDTGLVGKWKIVSLTNTPVGANTIVDRLKEMKDQGQNPSCLTETVYSFVKDKTGTVTIPAKCEDVYGPDAYKNNPQKFTWEIVGGSLFLNNTPDGNFDYKFQVNGNELILRSQYKDDYTKITYDERLAMKRQ
jgi:hypothetical protein